MASPPRLAGSVSCREWHWQAAHRRDFWVAFVIAGLLAGAVTWSIYLTQVLENQAGSDNALIADHSRVVSLGAEVFNEAVAGIRSNVEFLFSRVCRRFPDSDPGNISQALHSDQELATELCDLVATHSGLYANVRILNGTGFEVVRVLHNSSLGCQLLGDSQLRGRRDNTYFRAALNITDAPIFDPIDLQIDADDRYVEPFRPIMRCAHAAAVNITSSELMAVLVLTVSLEHTLRNIMASDQLAEEKSHRSLVVVDERGFYLASSDEKRELYGFRDHDELHQHEDEQGITLAGDDPIVWGRVQGAFAESRALLVEADRERREQRVQGGLNSIVRSDQPQLDPELEHRTTASTAVCTSHLRELALIGEDGVGSTGVVRVEFRDATVLGSAATLQLLGGASIAVVAFSSPVPVALAGPVVAGLAAILVVGYVVAAMVALYADWSHKDHMLDLSRERQEARRLFTRYIFHELRVPFNAISVGLDLLLSDTVDEAEPKGPDDDVGHESDPDATEGLNADPALQRFSALLRSMRFAADSMSSILDDVLDIERIESGRFQLHMRWWSPRAAVIDTLASQRSSFIRHGIQLRYDCQAVLVVPRDRGSDSHSTGMQASRIDRSFSGRPSASGLRTSTSSVSSQVTTVRIPMAAIQVMLDRGRILQSLSNFVSNAAKFRGTSSTVRVAVHVVLRGPLRAKSEMGSKDGGDSHQSMASTNESAGIIKGQPAPVPMIDPPLSNEGDARAVAPLHFLMFRPLEATSTDFAGRSLHSSMSHSLAIGVSPDETIEQTAHRVVQEVERVRELTRARTPRLRRGRARSSEATPVGPLASDGPEAIVSPVEADDDVDSAGDSLATHAAQAWWEVIRQLSKQRAPRSRPTQAAVAGIHVAGVQSDTEHAARIAPSRRRMRSGSETVEPRRRDSSEHGDASRRSQSSSRPIASVDNGFVAEAIEPSTVAADTGDSDSPAEVPSFLVDSGVLSGEHDEFTGRLRHRELVRTGPFAECDATLVLAVCDAGVGISEEAQRRLFQPFSQLRTGTNQPGSSGLGLAIVRMITEMHGGRVGISSRPGKGSTFFITIPCSARIPLALLEGAMSRSICPSNTLYPSRSDGSSTLQGARAAARFTSPKEGVPSVVGHGLLPETRVQVSKGLPAEDSSLTSPEVRPRHLGQSPSVSKRRLRTEPSSAEVVDPAAVTLSTAPSPSDQPADEKLAAPAASGGDSLPTSPAVVETGGTSDGTPSTAGSPMLLARSRDDRATRRETRRQNRGDRPAGAAAPSELVGSGAIDLGSPPAPGSTPVAPTPTPTLTPAPAPAPATPAPAASASSSGAGSSAATTSDRTARRSAATGPLFRALVVDDSESNRMVLSMLLGRMGAAVETAEDGQEAVEMVTRSRTDSSFSFDIITMDMVMPRMNGLTATKEIRSLGFRGPIIGVTGNALGDDTSSFMAAGANHILTKPVVTKTLVKLVKSFGISSRL